MVDFCPGEASAGCEAQPAFNYLRAGAASRGTGSSLLPGALHPALCQLIPSLGLYSSVSYFFISSPRFLGAGQKFLVERTCSEKEGARERGEKWECALWLTDMDTISLATINVPLKNIVRRRKIISV